MSNIGQSPRSAGLRVMSLNLRFGLADDGPNNWASRCVAYPELLRQHTCDFYAFQEANDFQINYLAGLLKDYEMIGQRDPAPRFWQNNVIFHRRQWRCLDHHHFYLSDTPDLPSQFSRSKWPRQCTIGTFAQAGCRLTVLNTHFDFEADVQRRSAVLICKRLDALTPAWPAVLMGDLNAGPHSSCLDIFTEPSAGFCSALCPPPAGTHHRFTGRALGDAIDWILYRGALQVRDAQVITDRYCGYYPSDHFPLTAWLCWRPADAPAI
jgi:endonuclease/exonuclease/phosphatase family metal-dependent hydrolase